MEAILLEIKNHVAVITINRADSLNAFNYETLLDLQIKVEKFGLIAKFGQFYLLVLVIRHLVSGRT